VGVDVVLRCFPGVVGRVVMMALCGVRMMSGFLVIAFVVMPCRFFVVPGCVFVMLGSMAMMVGCFLRHAGFSFIDPAGRIAVCKSKRSYVDRQLRQDEFVVNYRKHFIRSCFVGLWRRAGDPLCG
jgi:hypothetical protein